MPAPNLSILVKMSGGMLPPNSKAGDVEIYDNGRVVIYESDTDVVERHIDRQKIIDILQFSRQSGFFQLDSVIHDNANGLNVPDVTLSLTDSMSSTTVTMTAYQRLKGEMRKSPFDLVYKRVTDLAWESYTSAPPITPETSTPPSAPSNTASSAPSNDGGINLPSLEDILKSAPLDFSQPPAPNTNNLPPLQSQNAPTADRAGSLPSLPKAGNYSSQMGGGLPPLNSAPQNQGGSKQMPPMQAVPQARPNPVVVPPMQGQKPAVAAFPPQQPTSPPARPQQVKVEKRAEVKRPEPEQVAQPQPVKPKQVLSQPLVTPPVQKDSESPAVSPKVQSEKQKEPQPMPIYQNRTNETLPSPQQSPRENKPVPVTTAVQKVENTFRRPPVGWENTQDLISRLEETLHGKLIVFYSHGDHEIAMEDMRYLYSHLRKLGHKKTLYVLPIIPHSNGPVMWRMATLLREFCEEMTVIIPDESSVSSSLLSLAADTLLMNPFGYLSPIEVPFTHPLLDAQYNNVPVSMPLSEILQATMLFKNNVEKAKSGEVPQSMLHPLVMTSAQRQFSLVQMLCSNLLKLNKKHIKSPEMITSIVTQMTQQYPSEHYPIAFFEAKNIGLDVVETTEEMNDLLWDLLRQYIYLTHPVLNARQQQHSREQQSVIIESTGRRTVYYEEQHEDGDQVLDIHNRWREVTQQISINSGNKETHQLQWKDLQLMGSQEE